MADNGNPARFWKRRKVLVTGGTGFIGSHLVESLIQKGAVVTILTRKKHNLGYIADKKSSLRIVTGDAADHASAARACHGQDAVMNLAAHVSGIGYNRTHQATMMRDNLAIALTMIEEARRAKVKRFLVVSSACVYPHEASIPTPESEGFLGEPEGVNNGYGWAKRMAEKLGMLYAQEFGMGVGIVRPYNVYGPRDDFLSEDSHVIPALIRRIHDRENPVKVWGSGKQTRAFVYVDDVVRGLMSAVERYPVPEPVNIGSDEEISIRDLVLLIARLSGVSKKFVFDTSKPDGNPRRASDTRKAGRSLGFRTEVPLEEGLARTIAWYKDRYRSGQSKSTL